MKILKNNHVVGRLRGIRLISDDSELQSIYKILTLKGMHVLEPGPNKSDVEKFVPVSSKTLGLLAKTLEGFGYDVETNMKAGGVGSGRHKGDHVEQRKEEAQKEYKRTYKLAKQLGYDDAKAKEAAMDAFVSRFKSMEAGGPGSGRHPTGVSKKDNKTPKLSIVKTTKNWTNLFLHTLSDGRKVSSPYNYGIIDNKGKIIKLDRMDAGGPGSGRKPGFAKGLNKWKPMDQEIKQAAKDPKQKKLPLKAAELITSPELNVVSVPKGPQKTIKKVGTNFCVVSTGTDKNFGCYGSREQAEAVIAGRSFIEPNMPKDLLGFGDMGEPMAGSMGHAHIEPELWFNPPSQKRPSRVPVDEPNEKDDRFLDVTKRKQAKKDKMNRLKRAAPGGLPALIPAQTTLVAPHTASYHPGMEATAIKVRRTSDKRTRVSFDRQGCI